MDHLTHYYRPFTQPLLSLSALSDSEVDATLGHLGTYEPLPYRLSHPEYIGERRRIEAMMFSRFKEKGGRPELEHPYYFVLGEFSLWESDDSLRVQIAFDSVHPSCVSFTLTDSFFNYRRTNLHGVAIPSRSYHNKLFTAEGFEIVGSRGRRLHRQTVCPTGGKQFLPR